MPGRFPFEPLQKYPHMKPEDVAVWDRFVRNKPDYFDTIDYDVPLGKGATPDPTQPENLQADWTILTQKKVDAIGYKGSDVYIVEVKPTADMRALGQALTYAALYEADHPDEVPPRRMVVCGQVEREMESIYFLHNVLIETA